MSRSALRRNASRGATSPTKSISEKSPTVRLSLRLNRVHSTGLAFPTPSPCSDAAVGQSVGIRPRGDHRAIPDSGGRTSSLKLCLTLLCNEPNVRVLPNGVDFTANSWVESHGSAQPAGEMAPTVVREGPLGVLSLTCSAGTCPFTGHSANKGCSHDDCCADSTPQMSSRGLAGGDAGRVTRCRPTKSS